MIRIGAGQVAAHGDARVVDQYSDAGVSALHLCDPRELRLVMQVGTDDLDGTPGVIGEACRQRLEPCAMARDEDQIMTATCQPIGIDRADARRSPRSKRCAFRTCLPVLSPTLLHERRDPPCEEPTKPRTNAAISSAAVSKAK